MAIVVKTRNKKQEKAVTAFLEENDIDFSKVEEDAAIYKAPQKSRVSKKERVILQGLEESVDFVNKHKKGKVKVKSLKQLLDEL